MALEPSESIGEQNVAWDNASSIRDLMKDGGVTFSVLDKLDNPIDFDTPEDVFDPESLINSVNFSTIEAEDHSGMPFEAIKDKMKDVTEDGTVKKRVLREGIGEILPKESLVTIHYDAYFEFNEVPFDSSTLRGKAFEFLLSNSGVVMGLDIAVATMREREKAEFILQPSMAYGRYGCPPRIPANAEVLFVIEVVRFKLGSEAALARATGNKEEPKWEDVKHAFKALNSEAISLYKEERFKDSKFKLEKAKRLLEQCHLKNEEEETEQKHLLFKVYLNLALAFNSMIGSSSFAPSAIIHCKEALKIQPDNPKAHLQWGIALTTLGELEHARTHLLKAKKKLPGDQAVTSAWERLEKKKKHEREEESRFWKRAVNPGETVEEKDEELSPEAAEIFNQLKEFSASSELSLTLPSGMTAKEREEIESLTEKLNLNLQLRDKSILITKPKK